MEWAKGDLIEVAKARGIHTIGFTANAVVTQDRRLVMGIGAAKRVRDAFPGADRIIGDTLLDGYGALQATAGDVLLPDYHCCYAWNSRIPEWQFVAVQVKRHFSDGRDEASREACFALAERSLRRLRGRVPRDEPVVLNMPLVGAGGFASQADRVREMVERTLGSAPVVVCSL